MPNPTPQQRIEELARELEDGHRTYPDGTPRYEFMEKIRQALTQAYMAGREDKVEEIANLYEKNKAGKVPSEILTMAEVLAERVNHISRLKEQIKL